MLKHIVVDTFDSTLDSVCCIRICVCVSVCLYVYVNKHVCLLMYMYVFMCLCLCLCRYIYTHQSITCFNVVVRNMLDNCILNGIMRIANFHLLTFAMAILIPIFSSRNPTEKSLERSWIRRVDMVHCVSHIRTPHSTSASELSLLLRQPEISRGQWCLGAFTMQNNLLLRKWRWSWMKVRRERWWKNRWLEHKIWWWWSRRFIPAHPPM